MKLILALLLTLCPPMTDKDRHDLCHGPITVISDDDPGLRFFRDQSLESAKIALITERINACEAEEREGR